MANINLIWEHPETSPDHFSRPLRYLIDSPSKMAATAAFISFRERTLLPMIATHPGDRDLPKFLQCVEAVLAWRETIAPEQRFWQPDA